MRRSQIRGICGEKGKKYAFARIDIMEAKKGEGIEELKYQF